MANERTAPLEQKFAISNNPTQRHTTHTTFLINTLQTHSFRHDNG
jgi:hypothetical protein